MSTHLTHAGAFPFVGSQSTSILKRIGRSMLRCYLSYTPLKLGRYPIMMFCHKYLAENIMVETKTKDRGVMTVNLLDEMQYPVYYNIFEAKYNKCLEAILPLVKVAIDVGANIGQYSLLFAQSISKVYAFEPVPKKIGHLTYHININKLQQKVELIPKALSDFDGTATFALPYSEDNDGTGSLVLDETWESPRIQVDTITLDRYAKLQVLPPIQLIKMDIEGAELMALRGMEEILRKDKPMLILELNKPMMGVAGYTAFDVQAFLKPFGYSAYFMSKKGLKKIEKIDPWAENYLFVTSEYAAKLAHIVQD